MSDVKKILADAAALIRENGWVQEKYGSLGEGYCLVGAVIAASGGTGRYHVAYRVLTDEVENPLTWNDTKGRTQEEVLELLGRAARGH